MNANTDGSQANGFDIVERTLDWINDGKGAAWAIVVEAWGSSPCPSGSLLAINDSVAFVGSVSGGCVEGEVVTEALGLIREGASKLLDFGIADEDAWRVGLACGGRLRVFVTCITNQWRQVLVELVEAGRHKRPAGLVFPLEGGNPHLIVPGEKVSGAIMAVPELPEQVSDCLESDVSRVAELPNGNRLFVRVFNPPLRLLIVGAVHIAQALTAIARQADYEVIVIDPRESWATAERFPSIAFDRRWPSEALQELRPDRRTAIVSLSHDPKLDDPALVEALRSDAFYIGALGSHRTHTKRLKRLTRQGLGSETLERIHGPVGLDIGATTPSEIAVSIMAEVVSARRGVVRRKGGVRGNDVER